MQFYIIVILSVFAAACAQMLLKKAANITYPKLWRQYMNGWVIGGYAIIGLAMLANIYAMSKGVQLKELSMIEALSYLFVPSLSFMLFDERMNWMKIVAVAIIISGLIIFFI